MSDFFLRQGDTLYVSEKTYEALKKAVHLEPLGPGSLGAPIKVVKCSDEELERLSKFAENVTC